MKIERKTAEGGQGAPSRDFQALTNFSRSDGHTTRSPSPVIVGDSCLFGFLGDPKDAQKIGECGFRLLWDFIYYGSDSMRTPGGLTLTDR